MSDYPIKWHKISNGYDDEFESYRDRESFIYITEAGAVEAWRSSSSIEDPVLAPTGYLGGISPLEDSAVERA